MLYPLFNQVKVSLRLKSFQELFGQEGNINFVTAIKHKQYKQPNANVT